MRNYKHYIKREKESKVFAVFALIVLLMLVALIILQLCGMFDEPLWKPNISYPMVNTNVSWQQTWAFGGVAK